MFDHVGEVVPDAGPDPFTFRFGLPKVQVEDNLAHRGRCVDVFADRNDVRLVVELADDSVVVPAAPAGEPVKTVAEHIVNVALPDAVDEALQRVALVADV